MSMFAGDLLIKTTIEMGLEDLRKNPWLIEECFSFVLDHPVLRDKYGYKEIARAKEFLLNNNIPVYMKYRIDKEEVPCVTIQMEESYEDDSLATLADQDDDSQEYTPDQINKPIQYIVKPTNVLEYDNETGIVTIEENENFKYVSPGMFAIDPSTGNGFEINEVLTDNRFKIAIGSDLDVEKMGIIPKYQIYRAKRERIISKETYVIGCFSHGDPADLIFLYNAVKYILLRYREGLLERYNFQLSSIASSGVVPSQTFMSIGENVYSRFITLRGQTEETWVKTPFRIIEAVDIIERDGDLTASGITIISNKDGGDPVEDLWDTSDGED